MRVGPVTEPTEYAGSYLTRQAEVLADRVRRAGLVLTGQDLVAYEACLAGKATVGHLTLLRDLLTRIGR